MNIKDTLLQPPSRSLMMQIVDYVGDDPVRFGELIEVFTGGPYRLTQRAAWPLSYCVQEYPLLLGHHLDTLLQQLKMPRHNAVTRNILRLLQFVDIPDEHAGEVMNFCFDVLMRPKEPVANQAFAMTVLANLAGRYPEIKNEILLCIEDRMPNASPGFSVRARKVKKQLQKK